MRFKLFFLSLCLFVAQMGFSTNGTPDIPSTCDIVAPANFRVISVGTNFIEVAWVPVGPPPSSWRIKTFRNSNNSLVKTNYCTGATFVIPDLEPGVDYRIEINGECHFGQSSSQISVIPNKTTLILELIVNSFTPNTTSQNCYMDAPTTTVPCTFPSGGFNTFKIDHPATGPRYFQIKKTGTNTYTLKNGNGSQNGNQDYVFECKINSETFSSAPCNTIYAVSIKYQSKERAFFRLQEITTNGSLTNFNLVEIESGFTITSYNPPPNMMPDGGKNDREDDTTGNLMEGDQLSVAPNPFINQLIIHAPFTRENEPVQIALYDLQGRRISQQDTFGSADAAYTMATESLAPGMYFLAVEAAGVRQMVKLVKTE